MNIQKYKKALLALFALPLMVSCGDDQKKTDLTTNFTNDTKKLLKKFLDEKEDVFKTAITKSEFLEEVKKAGNGNNSNGAGAAAHTTATVKPEKTFKLVNGLDNDTNKIQKLNEIIDFVNELVAMVNDKKITQYNKYCKHVLGYEDSKLINASKFSPGEL